MKKISVQFHATSIDIHDFVAEMIGKGLHACGIKVYPSFEIVLDITKMTPVETNDLYMIFISKSNIPMADNYKEFISKQDNNIGITVGKERDGKLFESIIWMYSESEIDSDLKKCINSFKKKLNRGAWLKNPFDDNKKYFKNHLYSDNAKRAFESGVTICPIAGWNTYELTDK